VEERDYGLAERHRLDREDAVPARVQLIHDHVGAPVALERRAVVEALDDLEVDVQLGAGGHHVRGPLARARRGRVHDQRPLTFAWGRGLDRAQVDARGDHLRVRHPADRVVAPDDACARAPRPRKLRRRLAANIRAEEVHHRPLAERAQQRELNRLGQQREAEIEMEEVRVRRESCERAGLRQLLPEQPAGATEIEIGLRVELVAVEDDEPRVDATRSQRLNVRPRDACGVDGTVRDAHAATLPRELERLRDQGAATSPSR
jgi:hypothetical protein